MIELEEILNELNHRRGKEKSLRSRILIEQAIEALKEYEKAREAKG